MTHVLAGDIGGTRSRFTLYDVTGKRKLRHDVLESRHYATFEDALARFLEDTAKARIRPRIKAASFGIAGPVVEQRVKATNLPWVIDARIVSRALGGARTTLLNDLVALGLGAMTVPASKLAMIHGGRPKKKGGNVGVIAAGTGLGEASFIWDGASHVPCASEGGHVDFAPRTAIEFELRAKLAVQLGRVSYERVASGSSISMLYQFFVHDQRVKESRSASAYFTAAKDPNVAVVDLAEQGKSEAAMRALDLWCSIYGAETGNLALKFLATGGMFVCGGVSARLAPILARGLPARRRNGKRGGALSPFLEAYLDKGRMRGLLEGIPVAVVLDPRAGLRGAAAHAARIASRA
jgi:glucokinase